MPINATSPGALPKGTTSPLPPCPDTASLRQQVLARLDDIEARALPALAARRQMLDSIWRSDASDAELLFADGHEVIPTHPAGADRLAITLGEQHGLMLEAHALRELAAALDRYDAGGSALAAEIEGTGAGATQLVNSPAPAPSSDVVTGDERAHTLAMLRYLADVCDEIWTARRERDQTRHQQLEFESRELEKRIRERSAALRAASTAIAAAALSRSA